MLELNFPRRELTLDQTVWRISNALAVRYPHIEFAINTESIGGESIVEITYRGGPKRDDVYELVRLWGSKNIDASGENFFQEDGPLTVTPLGLEIIYSSVFIFVDRFRPVSSAPDLELRISSPVAGDARRPIYWLN